MPTSIPSTSLARNSPLQNRVLPDGAIAAIPQRGLFYGNRGGKIHDQSSQQLHPTKRWASRQWICCVLEFKQRKRPLMGPGYTELFFMDEVSALAAGHRPCFECRRADAINFARAWNKAGERAKAPEMDRILHSQRLAGKTKQTTSLHWQHLPDAAMVRIGHDVIAKSPNGPLRWSFSGYRPADNLLQELEGHALECLTPPAILDTLTNGYIPHWHPTAALGDDRNAQI